MATKSSGFLFSSIAGVAMQRVMLCLTLVSLIYDINPCTLDMELQEAVIGAALLPTYFKQAWQLLRSGGVFLNHGIASDSFDAAQAKGSFVNHYVFPDGELLPISSTLRAAETSGFEVRDVESLREHYVYTLRHWVRLLEEHAEEVRRITDEVTYRIWRLYISSSIHQFKSGRISIHQTLLVKPDGGGSGMPLTREDWYSTPFI